MVMRNTQLETMEEGCCCQAGDFQGEIGRPGAVDPVHGLEVEEEGCHRAADQLPPHHWETIGRGLLLPRRGASGEIRRPTHSQAGTISSRTINLNKVFTQY